MHHVSKGLFFDRQDDQIIITKTDDGKLPNEERSNVVFAQKMTKNEFASIIAHLSPDVDLDGALTVLNGLPKPTFNTSGLWTHYCEDECSIMMVGSGEECNWCGCTEDKQLRMAPPRWADLVSQLESVAAQLPYPMVAAQPPVPTPVPGSELYGLFTVGTIGEFTEVKLTPVLTPIITPLEYDPKN